MVTAQILGMTSRTLNSGDDRTDSGDDRTGRSDSGDDRHDNKGRNLLDSRDSGDDNRFSRGDQRDSGDSLSSSNSSRKNFVALLLLDTQRVTFFYVIAGPVASFLILRNFISVDRSSSSPF